MEKRLAIVDKQRCSPHTCAHECIKFDPVNRMGGVGFHIGEDGKAAIGEDVTTQAHQICAKKCPFNAIKLVRLPQEAQSNPIHRYGENGFRLYNLPIPVMGKVVGLVGRNGIGKSTAVKILSGIEFANLGENEPDTTYQKLINHYKGTIAQTYFEQLRDKKITVAYKPQAINFIPTQFQGTVQTLLEKAASDQTRLQMVIEKLHLAPLLTQDIQTLSGGELQRVAIGATATKTANVYIFDEPSSFLDIKQRIILAKFIRELADEHTAVMVIEHDLIMLDYMSDVIHIIYGSQTAYGIVSQAKSAKAGINMYLDGYLKEENVQFRDHQIHFHTRQERSDKEQATLTQWPQLTKKQGSFTLTVKPGELQRKDVIGILGENGIGKTTFAKLLAGVEKPTDGTIDLQTKISYKPQHIDTQSEELVMNVLSTAFEKFEHILVKPLQLDKIALQPLNSLSGGQLQNVAIAYCLSQEANLYVLDEPSAYLDTEQRLVVSKILKDFAVENGKTALIIDHDLLFIDYLSDKLLVFEGEPAKSGHVMGPFGLQEGMNTFLQDVQLTFRRDEQTNRPRANKAHSQMEQEQIQKNELYKI
ncbi:MAG: ribosome biogenesis/translation initiation ATPase RLI [Candidatus Woesearchaeota archaeon]